MYKDLRAQKSFQTMTAGRRPLLVLADGARWIWNEVDKNLPGAAGVLDIFHASEHLHATAVALYGEGAAAEAWFSADFRDRLLIAAQRA